jgi:apolipoprotein N-acyltransferase
MEADIQKTSETLTLRKSILYVTIAVLCFHAAYSSLKFPAAGLFIFGYAYGLVKLCEQSSVRRAFYFGLATGYLCYAPQTFFMWNIFGPLAPILWLVLAFWVGLFTAMACGCIRRWGKVKAMWLIPILWTGIEYFRSELYYLKFSWLNVGYALPVQASGFGVYHIGMYGVGFLIFCFAAAYPYKFLFKIKLLEWFLVIPIFSIVCALQFPTDRTPLRISFPTTVGIQMEFPSQGVLPKVLTQSLAKNTNAQIFVLSEYTLTEHPGGVPEALKDWCREHEKFLVIGGKQFVTNEAYYNTAFVIGTNGKIIFQQAKSVPIQFFADGLPATNQAVWSSPWGKIGICICYDLSYTRVTDELVRQGAQLIIVPTMDVENWGRHQHELHSRVAPVRAAEYGVPIFRLASSGISQAVTGYGRVVARTTMPGCGEILSAQLNLPMRGSLPLDRIIAPACVGITAIVLTVLLLLAWRDQGLMKKT